MSMAEVAHKAGVSYATVSRVLNNRPGVSRDKVDRVRRAVIEVGYVPPSAQDRRGREMGRRPGLRAGTLALLWTCSIDAALGGVGAGLLQGVTDGASSHGLNVQVDYIADAKRLPPSVKSGKVDGILLQGPAPAPSLDERLRNMPAVWMLSSGAGDWGDRVQPDNDAIGRIAARELIARGCRNLACIGYDSASVFPNFWRPRLEGFLYQCRIERKDPLVLGEGNPLNVPGGWARVESGLLDQLAASNPRPDGLFVSNEMLHSVVDGLAARGIEAGRDITIVTTDRENYRQAGLRERAIWINIHPEAIGRLAVEQLLWRLANPWAPRVAQLIQPELFLPTGE